MTNTLFVYGTLMPGSRDRFGNTARERLSEAGFWRGEASLRGVLYDLGGYPGLSETAEDYAAVSGAVIELYHPKDVFLWLDRYEGIDPQYPWASEYERVIRDVQHEAGDTLKAWVYIYRLTPDPANLITGGNWLEHIALPPADK